MRMTSIGPEHCIPQASVFLRRDILDEVGLFDEGYDLAMDYEMWLRLASRYPLTIVNKTLAAFRVTAETKTVQRCREMDLERFQASRRYWRLGRWPAKWVIAARRTQRFFLWTYENHACQYRRYNRWRSQMLP
jgi:hypothetical protein